MKRRVFRAGIIISDSENAHFSNSRTGKALLLRPSIQMFLALASLFWVCGIAADHVYQNCKFRLGVQLQHEEVGMG